MTERRRPGNNLSRIIYRIGGQGPAVVLLHGFAQTSHMWLPLMPVVREIGRRDIRPSSRD